MGHVIYVDAGFTNGVGSVAWLEVGGERGFKSGLSCKDSFRCEYAGLLYALEHCRGIEDGDEVEVLMDNKPVVEQLQSKSGINDEDIRKMAMKVWKWSAKGKNNLTVNWISRKENLAGKLLGS